MSVFNGDKVERSLNEAAAELKARIEAGNERRFPVMGLKGAANPLMLREAALRMPRPLLVITALASEAEALASEVAFFLDQAAHCDAAQAKVHLLPAWEVRPFAHLSPPPDDQAAQLAALFALRRTPAPLVVASVEALMMRTIAMRTFEDSVIRIALAENLDLEALVDALMAMGYQRVPQAEEAGDFSVRGGIVDIFSPLYQHPVRFELEEDLVTSIRHYDPSTQLSLGEVDEAVVIRTRLVPASYLRQPKVIDRVAMRCAEIGMVRKETAELTETLENGLLFPGVELIAPYIGEAGLQSVFDYLPPATLAWIIEPGRVVGEAERFAERIAAEAAAAQAKPLFHPAPAEIFLNAGEFERSLAALVSVEVGSLITVAVPREGWATPIEVKCQAALRLAATEFTGGRSVPSFSSNAG